MGRGAGRLTCAARLLFSTIAVAVIAVVLFGLPLAFVLSRLEINAAHQQVQRDATTVARTLQNRLGSQLPTDIADAADAARSLPDRYVSISQNGGRPPRSGTCPARGVITANAVPGTSGSPWQADNSVETAGSPRGWP